MAETLAGYVSSGVLPILVWDATTIGFARTEGKKERKATRMLLREVDRFWICKALEAIGFPSAYSWTEGEKAACAMAKLGLVSAVISADTDCHVFGVPIVATRAIACAGKVVLGEATLHSELVQLFQCSSEQLVDRFKDAAVFLGCDFCDRLPRNGPATYLKHMAAGKFFTPEIFHRATQEYQEDITRTLVFFTLSTPELALAKERYDLAIAGAWKENAELLQHMGLGETYKGISARLSARNFAPAQGERQTTDFASGIATESL
jgi:hypothetical protein